MHNDETGLFEKHMLMIIVDVKMKWLEVIPVPSTSFFATTWILRNLFT